MTTTAPRLSYLIAADGAQTPITPANGHTFKLDEMQKAVGGYIELVGLHLDTSHWLVVDEEGLLKRLPLNYAATLMAGSAIVGPAMLIPRDAID